MIHRSARAVDEIVHRMAKVAMVSFYQKRRTSLPYVFCRFDVLATQSADGIHGYSLQMLLASMNMMMTTADIQHLHNETNILPLNAHLKLHSSQLRQKSQHPTHPLHKFTVLTENERHKKQTIFDNNNNYTVNINTKSDLICEDLIQSNLKLIHSHIVSNHLSQRPPNNVLQDQTPSVFPAELLLSRESRRTLAQLRTNKSPLLVSYLFSIGDPRHPSPLCPLCLMHDHTSSHLFECKSLPTSLSSLDLWTNPDKVEPFLATWGRYCWLPHDFGCWTLLAARWWSGVDNNNNNNKTA